MKVPLAIPAPPRLTIRTPSGNMTGTMHADLVLWNARIWTAAPAQPTPEAVANGPALRRAGVSAGTPDPPGGRIDRDESGEPTGLLFDKAMALVDRHVPPPGDGELVAAAQAALAHAAGVGVTSLQTMCTPRETRILGRMRRDGLLSARLCAYTNASSPDEIGQDRLEAPADDAWLRTGGVKVFADGSFGAGSALLSEPYADAPRSCALAMQSPEELTELVRRADAAGLQVALHAIGDEAVRRSLDAFENAAAVNGPPDAGHRIEHAQLVRPADRARFAALGVIASIQPSHCIDDMRWIRKRLGPRCEYGTIEAGKLADLVLVDAYLPELRPQDLLAARVRLTVVDGRVVYGG